MADAMLARMLDGEDGVVHKVSLHEGGHWIMLIST